MIRQIDRIDFQQGNTAILILDNGDELEINVAQLYKKVADLRDEIDPNN